MREKLALRYRLAFGCVPAAVRQPDDIAGKGKGNDLAPPVRLHARKSHHTRADLVDMVRTVAFMEERLAEAEPAWHRVRRQGAWQPAHAVRILEWPDPSEHG
nr:hypothetical protein [Defluviimonas sp.]